MIFVLETLVRISARTLAILTERFLSRVPWTLSTQLVGSQFK
jgi:hypothetical protein